MGQRRERLGRVVGNRNSTCNDYVMLAKRRRLFVNSERGQAEAAVTLRQVDRQVVRVSGL